MNRYFRITPSAINRTTAERVSNAEVISNFDDLLKLNARQGKYVFVPMAEWTKRIHEIATSAKLRIIMLKSGVMANELVVEPLHLPFRVYGTEKQVLPERVYSAEEIKNLEFGKCVSDGKDVLEFDRIDASGNVKRALRMYVKIQ